MTRATRNGLALAAACGAAAGLAAAWTPPYRFTVGVRVWEDGSARVFYPEG